MTVADMKGWRDKYLGPQNALVLVGGDLTADEIVPLLEERLGGWKPEGVETAAEPPPIKPVEKTVMFLIDKPGAAQTMLRAGAPIGLQTDPDHYPLTVANEIFGRLFTGRVNMNLREDKGYTYGARCSLNHRYTEGLYFCSSAIRTDATADAVKELQRELKEVVGERPLSASEITYAKSSLLNGFKGQFETTGPVLDAYYDIWLYNLPGDWTEQFLPSVEAVTADAANAAIKERVIPDRFHWLVVGDKAIIAEGLEGLGFEMVELDRDGNPLADTK
jgi:zinc protease